MAGKISELRSENPTSIYVDAGDSVFGYTPPKALSEGRFHPVIDFYNLIKPDVLEIGNHELQFEGTRTASGKADNLAGFLREAGFPVICSNLVDAKTGEAPEGLKPYVMKEIPLPGGGVMKVGILGVVTQNMANRERHPLVGAGYDVTDPVEAMRKAIKAARTEGAEKIVLLHHDYTERAKHLAGEVDGIDVIIGAHDHRETMEPRLFDTPSGGKTLYVNSGSYSKYVGDLQLVIDSGTRRIIDFSHRLHPVDGATLPHGGILSLCREWERRYALVR
jgi:5'-nucleotidase